LLTKRKVTILLKKVNLTDLEKAIFKSYIIRKNIDISKSLLLKDYFDGFELNDYLKNEMNKLKLGTIKELEKNLEILIPKEDRKVNGAFFTPDYIVDFIIERLKPEFNDANIDPSCGCGAFLIGLIKYYKDNFNKNIKDIIKENIYGIDILKYNIRRVKILLSIFAMEHNEVLNENDFNILQRDSLKVNWIDLFERNSKGLFDNVIGNPPYVKLQDLPEELRQNLFNNWEAVNNGNFNLYFAFFELGYNLLENNGKLGYITPNHYFTSLSGISLRDFFAEKKCIKEIYDFRDKRVFDVQTYTAITILKKEKNDKIMYDRIKKDQKPIDFLRNTNTGINLLKDLDNKKWRLLKPKERGNINKIENIGTPITKILDIKASVATLKDKLYFLNTKNIKDNYYIKKYNNKEFKIEKEITRKLFKVSDFKNQKQCNNNKRRIIFPYEFDHNNDIKPIPEDKLKNKYPNCYSYFIAIRDELSKRDKGTINKKIDFWYLYGRKQGLDLKGKKLITPTYSKKPRFMLVNDEEALYTNGYGIFLKREKSLFDNPLESEENIEVIQKILNSKVMEYFISKTSAVISGGYFSFQKNYLARFSIPKFCNDEINKLKMTNDKTEIDKLLIDKYNLEI